MVESIHPPRPIEPNVRKAAWSAHRRPRLPKGSRRWLEHMTSEHMTSEHNGSAPLDGAWFGAR